MNTHTLHTHTPRRTHAHVHSPHVCAHTSTHPPRNTNQTHSHVTLHGNASNARIITTSQRPRSAPNHVRSDHEDQTQTRTPITRTSHTRALYIHHAHAHTHSVQSASITNQIHSRIIHARVATLRVATQYNTPPAIAAISIWLGSTGLLTWPARTTLARTHARARTARKRTRTRTRMLRRATTVRTKSCPIRPRGSDTDAHTNYTHITHTRVVHSPRACTHTLSTVCQHYESNTFTHHSRTRCNTTSCNTVQHAASHLKPSASGLAPRACSRGPAHSRAHTLAHAQRASAHAHAHACCAACLAAIFCQAHRLRFLVVARPLQLG